MLNQPSEKRVFPRVPVSLIAHCRIGNRFCKEAVCDLSKGGLYLRTRELARQGTEVRVALALPHDSGPKYCTLIGRVAREDRDTLGKLKGLGVCIDPAQTPLHDRTVLQGYIARAA
jgi:hypothetical protein